MQAGNRPVRFVVRFTGRRPDACREIVEEIKKKAPVWGGELFAKQIHTTGK